MAAGRVQSAPEIHPEGLRCSAAVAVCVHILHPSLRFRHLIASVKNKVGGGCVVQDGKASTWQVEAERLEKVSFGRLTLVAL